MLVISYLAAGVNGSMQLGTFVQVRAALFRYDVISFLKFITIFLIIIVTLSNFNLKILLILEYCFRYLCAGKAPAVDEGLAIKPHGLAINACELFHRILDCVCHPFHHFTF